jgi:hypothetical protein
VNVVAFVAVTVVAVAEEGALAIVAVLVIAVFLVDEVVAAVREVAGVLVVAERLLPLR